MGRWQRSHKLKLVQLPVIILRKITNWTKKNNEVWNHVRVQCLGLPVGFTLVLEVVHVTAGLRILSVLGLSLFRLSQLQKVSMVLHDKLSLFEALGSKYPSSFSFYVFDLLTFKSKK